MILLQDYIIEVRKTVKEDNVKWALIIFGLVAVFLIWRSASISYSIYQMKDWQSTEANLLVSRLDIDNDDEVDSYRTIVSYQYSFNGQSYQGDRIGFGYIHSNMDRHFEIADKLKYAKRIRIWVDPFQADRSAIAKGWNNTAVFFLFFTFTWICLITSGILWNYSEHSAGLRQFSKVLIGLVIVAFLVLLACLVIGNYSDRYTIKLEEKIEVFEYMTEKEIRKEKQLERIRKEAFRRANEGEDTISFQLEADTIYIDLK